MAGNPPVSPATLCDLCREISVDDRKLSSKLKGVPGGNGKILPIDTVRDDELPELPGLKTSGEKGCDFCSFLRTALLKRELPQGRRKVQIRMRFTCSKDLDYFLTYGLADLIVSLSSEDGVIDRDVLSFDIGSYDESVKDFLKIGGGPKTSPLCDENVQMLKDALDECCTTCHPLETTTFLPTRLIEVGQSPATFTRLVVTADDFPSALLSKESGLRYAALSYCWGSEVDALTQFKTTKGTLAEWRKSMPINSMSQVMQDAITVCRRLSINYLWIDAICILQDDKADWETESQLMGEIYKSAIVTIGVPSTTSCHTSFLERKASGAYPRIDIPFNSNVNAKIRGTFSIWDCGQPKSMQVGGVVESLWGQHFIIDMQALEILVSPWAMRGWVMQERHLSTRMITFGERFVQFHCSRTSMSDSGIQQSGGNFVPLFVQSAIDLKDQTDDRLHDHWRSLTTTFAGSALTKPEDRLPALSGMASLFAGLTGDQYFAGLWGGDLLRELLWTPGQPCFADLPALLCQLRAPNPFLAPSWSWASQNASVNEYIGGFSIDRESRTSKSNRRPEAKRVEASADIEGENLFGRVRSGAIRLSGKSIPILSTPIYVTDKDGEIAWKVLHEGNYFAHCKFDWRSPDAGLAPGRLIMLLLVSACSKNTAFWDGLEENEREIYAAKEANRSEQTVGDELVGECERCKRPDHNRHAWGLILHPSDEPGIYYRVGIFTSRARSLTTTHCGTNAFAKAEFRDFEIR